MIIQKSIFCKVETFASTSKSLLKVESISSKYKINLLNCNCTIWLSDQYMYDIFIRKYYKIYIRKIYTFFTRTKIKMKMLSNKDCI